MKNLLRAKRSWVSAVFGLTTSLAHAQTAALDNTFGANGRVFTTFTAAPASDAAKAVVLQPDGKIVVAGNGQAGLELARYNPDGTLDASFGAGGKIATMIAPATGSPCFAPQPTAPSSTTWGMCLQTDGKVVVVGSSSDMASFVVRFLPNGTPDPGFGNSGVANICGGTVAGYAVRVGQQPTGELLVLGVGFPSATAPAAVYRMRDNGTIDNTYSGSLGRSAARFTDGFVDNAGRAVAVGSERVPIDPVTGSFGYRLVLARFAASGAPDATFGTNGVADQGLFPIGYPSHARAVAELPDGKLLVLGEILPDDLPASQFLDVYNSDFTPDATFGNNGLFLLGGTVISGGTISAYDYSEMALQADGKILLVGTFDGDFTLRRLLPNGQTDTSYGLNGNVTVNEDLNDGLADVLVQPDGKAVAVGYAASTPRGAAQPNSRFAVLRVLRTGGGLGTRAGQGFAAGATLQAAPNPSRGEALNVTVGWAAPTGGPVTVELVSALGQIVARTAAAPAGADQTRHTAVLPAQTLAAGVYTLRAQGAQGVVTGKVVLQ